MRKLQVGDRVRFLDSVGGGMIKGFLNKEVVIVEDEHGFDVPVLAKQCVVVEPAETERLQQSEGEFSKEEQNDKESSPTKIAVTEEVYETSEGNEITSALVFLPVDAKSISQTPFECYFVNDSNYYLFVNYMSRENNNWKSRYTGLIEPNTQIFIEEFDKSALNEIEKVCVQYIAFKHNKSYDYKNPVSVELRIDTVKFYKLHSFTDNDYFDENALTYYITRKDLPEREMLVSAGDLQRSFQEKIIIDNNRKLQKTVKKEKNTPIEVDLHIHQLLDDTTGMDNAALLEYQLSKFHETMQSNIKRKGQKIVFIHGKGDGVLKSALIKELTKHYKNAYYQDASFREYGFGATMITIR